MTTVYDVPPDQLINTLADAMKSEFKLTPPEWIENVRTGTHTQVEPAQEGWWHIRTAAVLRKIYINGPIGSDRLAEHFGGPKNRGAKPSKAVSGSRSIIRDILQQFDDAGITVKLPGKGRKITPKGVSICNRSAHEVMKVLAVENPELTKY
jgi:small subunit ribosomal protein S19e